MAMLFLLVLSSLFSQASVNFVEPYGFSFTSFDSKSCRTNGNLICHGSVTTGNGSLYITPNDQAKHTDNQVGRVLFSHPVLAWPASFSTTFNIKILKDPSSSMSGDGMSFIMAQDARSSPSESYGSYLGILDPPTQGGVYRQLAVELDTCKNEGDFEPDANHLAIDTTSVAEPITVRSLNGAGINLTSGREITVRIEYEGWSKILEVYMAYAGEPLVSVLSKKVIMKNTVPKQVYVGFTASTGSRWETHQVLGWNFTVYELNEQSLGFGVDQKDNKFKVILIVLFPVVIGLLVMAVVVVLRVRRRSETSMRKEAFEMLTRNPENAPRRFTCRQLSKATCNFSKENLLGTGGFGSVYKGVLSNPSATVAVKKISATSTQGEKEYLAEICTIGRLRHKNLVRLQGWCQDRDQLLLVYEYMPNGSLDRYIGKQFLDWETRYKILTGLATVLVYLHEECGSPVVHRDVKPNNVMLDANFNAHLGDFGLARLLQTDSAVTTIIAGTPGYLAPEVSFTGKAMPESDVYSFGMVVLEVVCGRRSKGFMDENSLVDFVWSCYEKKVLLNCVDQLLRGKLDEEQVKRTLVVGLACLHPDFMSRPRMRKVVQIFLNPEEPLMKVPESRPSAVCVPLYSSSSSTITITTGKTHDHKISVESLPDEMTVLYETSVVGC